MRSAHAVPGTRAARRRVWRRLSASCPEGIPKRYRKTVRRLDMLSLQMKRVKRLAAALLAGVLVASFAAAAWAGKDEQRLRFLGEVQFPTGLLFQGTQVGGLSGIDYDPRSGPQGLYYAISDDRSSINPARFYELTIDLRDGTLDDGDVVFRRVVTILNEQGQPFAPLSLDPESIR